jgi:hypothetical protein
MAFTDRVAMKAVGAFPIRPTTARFRPLDGAGWGGVMPQEAGGRRRNQPQPVLSLPVVATRVAVLTPSQTLPHQGGGLNAAAAADVS